MRATTAALKAEMKKDIIKIYHRNNSKLRKMTDAQRARHKADKAEHFTKKWIALKDGAETEAQKKYCDTVLNRIKIILG